MFQPAHQRVDEAHYVRREEGAESAATQRFPLTSEQEGAEDEPAPEASHRPSDAHAAAASPGKSAPALAIAPQLLDAMAREHPGMYSREVLAERLQSALQQLGPDVVAPAPERLALWLDAL